MTTTTQNTSEREAILTALGVWVRQRPGLEYGNYGDRASYFSEVRRITKQLHAARELLAAVAMRQSITADDLKAAFHAYSGRLTWKLAGSCRHCDKPEIEHTAGHWHTFTPATESHLDYVTGQYWPTEYRAAACAVLASALWAFYRASLKPVTIATVSGEYDRYTVYGKKGLNFRDAIRRAAKMDAGFSRSALGWLD